MKSKVSIFIVLTLILVFSAVLRMHSFYLPHNSGDQIFYLSLAMKLEQSGLAGYNLKGIDIISDGNILAVVNSRDPERGTLLEGLERGNVFYYSEQPLNNKPPAYSFLLMLSHKIFSPDKPYLSVDGNLGNQAIFLRPKVFLNSQFYAVGINFVFSLLFISIIFFLAQALFNERVGLWASLLMAVSPLNLLTSQRLWADDMLSVFCALSILLFLQGKKRLICF